MNQSFMLHERLRKYSTEDVAALYSDLNITPAGLNEEQVGEMRKKYGENQPVGKQSDTVFFRLRKAFVNPFSVILFLLAIVSFITDVWLATGKFRNITTVIIILMMLLISGIVRFVQEMKAKQIADRLTKIISTTVSVWRDGQAIEVSSEEIVVGDTVILSAGDRIPADMRLIRTSDLFVSQSVLTGESAIAEKKADTVSACNLGNYLSAENLAYMGTGIFSGSGEGIVLAVGKDTVYGNFSNNMINKKSGFDKGVTSIANVMIRFIAVLIPIVFVISGITKGEWMTSFLLALSVAVGLIPEMLPMVINACLAKGSAAMGKKQTVVKNINAMQGFGSMDVLCVDKTGTLTGDTILLEYYTDILGNESLHTLDYGYLNSIYHTGVKNHLDDAILKYQEMPGKENHFSDLMGRHQKLDEIPFDYERKCVSILVTGEHGAARMLVKGSLDNVISRCKYVEYQGSTQKIDDDAMTSVHAIVDEMLEDGMKVIAVAFKDMNGKEGIEVSDEVDLTLTGYLVFFDSPKKTAASAIEKLKNLHVKTKVLTGDQKSVAISVCRRLDVDISRIITGGELNSLSEDEILFAVEDTDIFAELTPKQKALIVRTIQENGHTVGFLGDGMNDFPAMTDADVGISVDTAIDAVKEAADVVLLKKDLNVLEEGILEGRKAFANMLKYIKITASSNFGNIFAIVLATAFLPFFPMTAIQLLLLNLLYDILCIALPWDYVDEEVYHLPQEWSGKSLGKFMLFFGPISTLFDVVTFFFLYFILCPSIFGGTFTELTDVVLQEGFISAFQTGWFLVSMWTQVLILHMLRTKKLPFIESRPSPVVFGITVFGILLFTGLTLSPIANWIGLAVLPPRYFVFLTAVVFCYMALTTFAKKYYVYKYKELT